MALALVDDELALDSSAETGVAATALAFWAQSWTTAITYLGLPSKQFRACRDRVLAAIGREDLAQSE